jgi:hypothetical protein
MSDNGDAHAPGPVTAVTKIPEIVLVELVERAEQRPERTVTVDEVMGDLAASRGGVRPRVVGSAGALRSARALADDNVVEGCVREVWGALIAIVLETLDGPGAAEAAWYKVLEADPKNPSARLHSYGS